MSTRMNTGPETRRVEIPIDGIRLYGDLTVPDDALGIVLFAHGSGSSRMSTRNRAVATRLQEGRMATLLLDLLTQDEELVDTRTREHRFDIPLLAARLVEATNWVRGRNETRHLPVGYFGASTGAAAALVAAASMREVVKAIVSRGGRPDLAGAALATVAAPTLLIVGGDDPIVLELNRDALQRMHGDRELAVVPNASHLFEEPGALDDVARLARHWFAQHMDRRMMPQSTNSAW